MKKLIYILVAFIAFVIGTAAYYSSPKIIPASVYEITQNVELYQRQRIYIKGNLEIFKSKSGEPRIYASIFDYKKFCSKNCIAGADVDLTKIIENDKEVSNFVNELIEKSEQTNFENGGYFAEVEITGEIEKTRGCFTSGYLIKAESIKQISPIEFMSRSELEKIIGRNNP